MTVPSSDTAGIRQTIHALRDAGWELDFVCDGEEDIPITDENKAIADLTAVDQSYLNVKRTRDGQEVTGHVFFVLGNDPDEVICDYTTNLDPTISDLQRSWF